MGSHAWCSWSCDCKSTGVNPVPHFLCRMCTIEPLICVFFYFFFFYFIIISVTSFMATSPYAAADSAQIQGKASYCHYCVYVNTSMVFSSIKRQLDWLSLLWPWFRLVIGTLASSLLAQCNTKCFHICCGLANNAVEHITRIREVYTFC